jgi:hypothetical protein
VSIDDRDNYNNRDEIPPVPRRMTFADVEARVRGPAIGLILLGVLSLGLIGVGVAQYPTLPAKFDEQREEIDNNPQLSPEQKQQMKDVMQVYQDAVVKFAPVAWAISGVISLLMIGAGVKMMSLSGRGLGITAAIVAMVPCLSGCCILGLPIGIWTLVVLSKPEVQAAFAARRTRRPEPDVLDPGFDDR